MAAAPTIEEQIAAEERSPMTEAERPYCLAGLAELTETQGTKLTEIDRLCVVRGRQTYQPRLEETNRGFKVREVDERSKRLSTGVNASPFFINNLSISGVPVSPFGCTRSHALLIGFFVDACNLAGDGEFRLVPDD